MAAQLRVERRVLPHLAAQLPVAVPDPDGVCEDHGSMRYRWLTGRAFDAAMLDTVGVERMAEQLSALLTTGPAVPGFAGKRAWSRTNGSARGDRPIRQDRASSPTCTESGAAPLGRGA
ncbi:MAG: hypothetical protein ACR2MA_04640 [Egibacteraceae bacterium]